MKLLNELVKQVKSLGPLKRVWFSTFNLDIAFFERHVLPALLMDEPPLNRMDYEKLQQQMAESHIDVLIFCDMRMLEADQLKRTTVPVHGILPVWLNNSSFDQESLFHPKVILLEDTQGRMILGAGSANLSISGWGRNQEVFIFKEVSNNQQYQQIKHFFSPLLNAAGIDTTNDPFPRRHRFTGNDTAWRFVHSFEQKNFLNELVDGISAHQFSIWSPYFSRDLPDLLERISAHLNLQLTFCIVPDRINNDYIRTEWSPAVDKLIQNDVLRFHDRPSPRTDNIDMTHAKLWLASGDKSQGTKSRLAIGSWNCTGPGCASLERPNIEAGILLDVEHNTHIAGEVLQLDKNHFASAEVLAQEALDVDPYPLPFELQVSFDWKNAIYEVQGQLYKKTDHMDYYLRLPGLKEDIALVWKDRKSAGSWPLQAIACEADSYEALLANHCYEVCQLGELVFRGLVQETGAAYRPAQHYDSLDDLLNDVIHGVDGKTSTATRLAPTLRESGLTDEEEPELAIKANGQVQSYFRLFQAFEQLRQRIQAVTSLTELEKLLFMYPGSIQEVIEKVNLKIAEKGNPVYRWFLWQEAHSLQQTALKAYDRLRPKHSRKQPPDTGQWSRLKLTRAVVLPPTIRSNPQYMQQLKEMCHYEH